MYNIGYMFCAIDFVIDFLLLQHQPSHIVEMTKSLFGLSQYTKQLIFFATSLDTHFPFTESDISHYTKQGEEIRQKLLVSVLEV